MYPSENIQSCHTEHCKRQLVQNTHTAWASKYMNHSMMSYIWVKPSVCSYRRFSRLLLKSFIMSERKSLLTSISSELGEEFFRRVATTFKITEWRTISVMRKEGWKPEMGAVCLNNARMRRWSCGVFTYWGSGSWQWSQAQGGACEPPAYRPALSESAQMGGD